MAIAYISTLGVAMLSVWLLTTIVIPHRLSREAPTDGLWFDREFRWNDSTGQWNVTSEIRAPAKVTAILDAPGGPAQSTDEAIAATLDELKAVGNWSGWQRDGVVWTRPQEDYAFQFVQDFVIPALNESAYERITAKFIGPAEEIRHFYPQGAAYGEQSGKESRNTHTRYVGNALKVKFDKPTTGQVIEESFWESLASALVKLPESLAEWISSGMKSLGLMILGAMFPKWFGKAHDKGNGAGGPPAE